MRNPQISVLDDALEGDASARSALVSDLGPSIWGLCRRLDPDPEDAYQAVWERLWGVLHRYDPDGAASLKTWTLTIARRMLTDRHRRRKSQGEVVSLEALPAVHPDADRRIAERQRAQRLDAALRRLPHAQREVVVLHHLEGWPLEQIADELGVRVGTVKSRLHRGRARLAQWMREA